MSDTPAEQTIACPKCGKRYKWPDQMATRTAACKGCGRMLRFPPRYAAVASVVAEAAPFSGRAPDKPEAAADDGEYDVIEPAPPSLPSGQSASGESLPYRTVTVTVPLHPTHRTPITRDSRWSVTRAAQDESKGLYVFRVIALILNGLLAGAGVISLMMCNPCGLVLGGVLGGVNLFWLAQGTYDGAQRRIISIVLNAVGLMLGIFLCSLFLFIDKLPVQVYTDIPVNARQLMMIIYIPLGSLIILACGTAMVYSCMRRHE